MAGKPKFKPEVTRIRLNPEQAILLCICYNVGRSPGLRTCSSKAMTVCSTEEKLTTSSIYLSSAVSS